VIPHGIDPEFFTPDGPTKPRDDTFRFIFVGGTIARKGVDILIDAYVRAFTHHDRVALLVKDSNTASFYKGQTLGENLRNFSQHPGMPRLDYIDRLISDDDLGQLYRTADCFVLPYRGEGFGMPVLEAMGCGLPVIVTAGGATDDFVDETVGWRIFADRRELALDTPPFRTVTTPWLLEPQIDSLATLMRYAYEHRDEAKRRGTAAAQRAIRQWTWDHAAARVEARLEEIQRREAVPPKRRTERYADPTRYANRIYGAGELDGVLLELFARLGSAQRTYVEITDGAPPTLGLILGRSLKWTGLVIDSDNTSARLLQTRFSEAPRTTVRVQSFSPSTIADLVTREGIPAEFDLLSLGCRDAAGIWTALAALRPRAVAWMSDGQTDIMPHALSLGYHCIAIDGRRADRIFVREDLAARAAFIPAATEPLP
jgi:hypothetical protein